MTTTPVVTPSPSTPIAGDPRRPASPAAGAGSPTLRVADLITEFHTRRGRVRAVDGVSFEVPSGGVLAVIGESGSGKSAMLRSLIGINPPTTTITGRIELAGQDILALPARQRRRVRGRDIAMVFQDPLTALDPVYTVENQLVETIKKQHPGIGADGARHRALELLELVQIPSPQTRLKAYPNELSGGMRQRVVIAMAIAGRPQVLLADEPTTALDVTVQARMMRLFREIQNDIGMALIVVTHDLGVAAELADDVAVMYAGRFVEHGSAPDVLRHPTHPYTEGLIDANVRAGQDRRPLAIPGTPPSLTRLPPGCAFAPRCRYAVGACWESSVPVHGTPAHWSRCLLAEDVA